MNNFERHEAIEGLLAKHTARELAGMAVDFSDKEKVLFEAFTLYFEICELKDEMKAKNEELKNFLNEGYASCED